MTPDCSLWRHRARLSSLIAEASWLVFGQCLSIVGGLLMVVVLTRSLGPELYGIFVLLIGLEALALNLSANATLQASMRLYSNYRKGEGYHILRVATRRLLGICVGLGGFGLAVAVAFMERSTPLVICTVLIAILVIDAMRVYSTSMLNAMRRQRMMVSWQVSDVWLRMLGALAAVLFVAPTVLSALVGVMVGALLANIAIWFVMAAGYRKTPRPYKPYLEVTSDASEASIRKELWSYTFAMLPIGFFGWLSGMGDKYVIAGLLSASDVGLYAATYGIISRPYRALASFLDVFLRPRLYDAATAERRGALRSILLAWVGSALVVGGAGAVLLVLVSQELLKFFFGEEYASVGGIVGWIALAYTLFNVQLAFARICHAYKLPHLVLWIQSIPAVLNIVLCLFLVPHVGLVGAAYAVVVSFALQTVIAAGLSVHAVRIGRA